MLKLGVEVSDLLMGTSELGEVEIMELEVIVAADDAELVAVSDGMIMSVIENGYGLSEMVRSVLQQSSSLRP